MNIYLTGVDRDEQTSFSRWPFSVLDDELNEQLARGGALAGEVLYHKYSVERIHSFENKDMKQAYVYNMMT